MADEPEDEGLGEIQTAEPTDADFYEVEDGFIIFPHGAQWFAETYDFSALRVRMSTRDVEGMDCKTGQWRKPSQTGQTGQLKAIKREPNPKA